MQANNQYDIIVVGGGISGSMAAVAAGRDGARVLLVEQYGFLGGMLTAAGVGPMMTFHAGQKQIIKGITGELIDRLKAKGKSPGHLYDTTAYTYSLTPFDAEGMKHELDLMCRQAGVQVLFHTMLAKVNVSGDTIESIDVCNKAGLTNLHAKVYVDATGDADLAVWAGVPCTKGRAEDGQNQPATMKFKMANVDTQKIRDYIKKNMQDFPTLTDPSSIDKGERLSIGGFISIVKAAKE
jgi:flavin-dependent dehydrogenase